MGDAQVTLLEAVESYSHRSSSRPGSAHDWSHIQRVRDIALLLAGTEGADPLVVEVSALMHDIFDHKITGSYDFARNATIRWLDHHGAPENLSDQVGSIVHGISFRGGASVDVELQIEGACVRDADRLDAMGAIGVARAVSYGAERGQAFWDRNLIPNLSLDESEYLRAETTTVNHFFEKLLQLRSRLSTKAGIAMGVGRHRAMVQYLRELLAELDTSGDWLRSFNGEVLLR